MIFNSHSDLVGQHAFLGASKYHWVGYDEAKLADSYRRNFAVERGTKLHTLAAMCIELGQKLPKTKQALNLYVNDAIGYMMEPERVLFYSYNAFGTVDAISFRKNFLRIHDLKTGTIKASIQQLEIYAAFFCLEYRMKPEHMDMELRIYQDDNFVVETPEPECISEIMNKIVAFDKIINTIESEEKP